MKDARDDYEEDMGILGCYISAVRQSVWVQVGDPKDVGRHPRVVNLFD